MGRTGGRTAQRLERKHRPQLGLHGARAGRCSTWWAGEAGLSIPPCTGHRALAGCGRGVTSGLGSFLRLWEVSGSHSPANSEKPRLLKGQGSARVLKGCLRGKAQHLLHRELSCRVLPSGQAKMKVVRPLMPYCSDVGTTSLG